MLRDKIWVPWRPLGDFYHSVWLHEMGGELKVNEAFHSDRISERSRRLLQKGRWEILPCR